MARYTGPVCRLCRREGQKLFLKGERCYSEKCSVGRRAYAPGQHGQGRKKTSEYGMQLRANFEMAERKVGVTGENLLRILESRLDNVVYRAGFASSRAEARQLVGHGHFTVNGIRVDIASYLLKAGDVISVAEGSRSSEKIKAVMEANAGRPAPQWLNVNRDAFTVSVVNLPERDAIDAPIEEQLIVEFYSK